jgi:dTDP-4-dehydrorhamnose 3,5-epimerase
MKLIQTSIPDVVIIEPAVFGDERGWFMESFNEAKLHAALEALGLPKPRAFVQDNHSSSAKGVLRGLHYQRAPHAQGKLVRVVRGAAYDVAVDIRPDSKTYLQWVGVELSAENNLMLWIPEGFAHGFVALEDDTHFLYKTTDTYDKESEGSIRWNDPAIGIDWPAIGDLIISDKDVDAPLSSSIENQSRSSSEKLGEHSEISFNILGDDRGSLISLEVGIEIPFDVKRAYYIFGTQLGVSRGFHAHRHLQQLAVCVSGRCTMLLDDGTEVTHVQLDSPTKGVLIKNLVWREMHDFSDDCVLVVFASEHYSELDYIRNYDAFKEHIANA